MAAIALALGASLTWGLADFYGPLKGRTLGALRVLFYVQLSGLVAIAIVVAIRGAGPAGLAVLLAIPAAISGTFGLYAYYRGVAVGTISIVAPIAGLAAVIPVAVGIASGDRPSSWQVAGMVCALGGVFLASREPAAERPVRVSGPVEGAWGRREAPVREADRGKGSGETGRFPQLVFTPNREVPPAGFRVAPGVGLALLAALGFGGYFPTMHVAGNTDFWWASVLFRTTSTLVILVVLALRKPSLSVERKHLLPLALVGIGDMLGNLLFAAASTTGLVSVTSVLASLYPIVTVVMARLVVNERVARSQEGGIALTLAGVALISAG